MKNRDQRVVSDALPWKKILAVVSLFFFTGLLYLLQQYGSFFMGSIVGQPSYVLENYSCPTTGFAFESSPVPELVSYRKGDTDFNRKEMLRINKKNQGFTAWFTYDMAFNEGLKSQLIDFIAYERNPDQYLAKIYDTIKSNTSLHGAADFVTKWLSPDNIHLPTVYPYGAGLVVEAGVKSGYGNSVSVCSTLSDGSKQLKILYTVAHLDSIAVTAGQTISAGTELGKIGTTGSSTTPHAHISIMPDLVWVPNYKEVYNAGYKSYFPANINEILVKLIDPVSVMLNPDMAYSIVLNDQKRQNVFNNASQYIAGLTSAVAFNGGLIADSSGASIITAPPQPVFTDFRITATPEKAKVGEQITVTVDAIDQNAQPFPGFSEAINVALSSSTAQFTGVKTMQAGKTTFQISDTTPGEVVMQVSNNGSIGEEKKIFFTDQLKFLEVTAPQKTTVGNTVAVGIRPVGLRGGVITESVAVLASVFPAVSGNQNIMLDAGRGEYLFKADQEGIYQLSFTAENVTEQVQVTVQKSEGTVSTTAPEETTSTNPEVSQSSSEVTPESSSIPPVPVLPESTSLIKILSGDLYRMYEVDGMTLLVFNDKNVTTEYPVEMKFDVPEGTDAVSIFSGLNDRNFPDTGELKLSKYQPGQKTVRYYPKYVPEDTYKKIVAYKAGEVLSSKVFTWSPMSQHVFTDVVKDVTDPEIYQAVKALKDSGVAKGNPDGSFGVDQPINRAATATILIRAFYSDIHLDTLKVTSLSFKDVAKTAWYASAIWFASQSEYEGAEKPVIIKGYDGKANPDGNVKLEEFLTMVLRILQVETPVTDPWYEGAVAKSIELNLISEAERKLIDKPLERGIVARVLVKALKLLADGVVKIEERTEKTRGTEGDETDQADATGGPVADQPVVEAVPETVATVPVSENTVKSAAATNLRFEFSGSGLTLTWDSEFAGPFKIYRETVGGNGEILIGTTGGKLFTDVSAKAGKQYFYRVEYDSSSARAEISVSL